MPAVSGAAPPSAFRTALACGLMVAATLAVFFAVNGLGAGLVAPGPARALPHGRPAGAGADLVGPVLLALVVVILTARAVGALFGWLRQPPVIGEVIAGILLGPSLFGRVAPEASSYIFRPEILPALGVLAQIGVILFIFLVGMELDTDLIRERSRTAATISVASMTTAFALGAILALWLYPRLSSSDVPFSLFALFLGLAMSVTAFPVLVRILTDRGIQKTEVGALAISCASVDDVAAWCLLAFVSSVSGARFAGAWSTVGLTLGYVVLMIVVARPLMRTLVFRQERLGVSTQTSLGLMVLAMLTSALATEWIGIHALFGAFLLGAVIPHDSRLAREIGRKLQDFVVVLFLPIFFAFTGLRTELHLVRGIEQWGMCIAITLVACLGKLGGTTVGSRMSGFDWRDSVALGALMNTRGLMELIVLNVGLDQGVISSTLFSMMVVMAVVTTLAAGPVLDVLARRPPAVTAASERASA
jgi:Kef-type K+ transport system membrane component KefB